MATKKSYEQIKAQCAEQGVPLNDKLYVEQGWDSILVGNYGAGHVLYNTVSGSFTGTTPAGVRFDSTKRPEGRGPTPKWYTSIWAFFYDMITTFKARLAPTFETQPPNERLYEVVTPEGERVASATNQMACAMLAGLLNGVTNGWHAGDLGDRLIEGEPE